MKFSMLIVVSGLFLGSFSALAAEPRGVLRIPVAGDSGTSLKQINTLLQARGLEKLPAFIDLDSKMTLTELQQLKDSVDNRIGEVSQYENLETSSVYGEVVDGRKACFLGSNKALLKIYRNMIELFLSEQFSILASSTKQPNHFGIKYDESDSGNSGTWINIYKCKD